MPKRTKTVKTDLERLLDLGAHLVPVRDKIPMTKSWQNNPATLADVQAHELVGGDFGLVPASLGLAAVDIDLPEAMKRTAAGREHADSGARAVAEHLGAKPLGSQRTASGGLHLFYAAEPAGNRKWTLSEFQGDIRSAKGQVVIYQAGRVLAAAEAMADRPAVDLSPLWEDATGDLWEPGHRNETLNKTVFLATVDGRPADISAAKQAALDAGLPAVEVEATAKSAVEAGRKEARNRAHTSEDDLAVAVAKRYGPDLRFAGALGWHVWTGTHWRLDPRGNAAFRACRIVAESWKLKRQADRKRVLRKAFYAGAHGILAVIDPVYAPPDRWDRAESKMLFNCANGTLDLETGELRPHNRDDYLTTCSAAEFSDTPDPAAAAAWGDFVSAVLPDAAERELFQEHVGYGLSADVAADEFVMLLGEPGSGKSTLLEAIMRVWGTHGAVFDPAMFLEGARGHLTEVMQFRGKRLAVCAELPRRGMLDLSRLNSLTGDDFLSGRYMRQDFVTFPRSHKLIFAGNTRPSFGDTTGHGITRRLLLLEAAPPLPVAQRDPTLAARLAQPAVQSAILAWAVEGFCRFRDRGFAHHIPASVRARNETAFEADDPLGEFLADRLRPLPGARLATADIYAEYQQWCERAGQRPFARRNLIGELVRRGYPRPLSNGVIPTVGPGSRHAVRGRCIEGYTLAESPLEVDF